MHDRLISKNSDGADGCVVVMTWHALLVHVHFTIEADWLDVFVSMQMLLVYSV